MKVQRSYRQVGIQRSHKNIIFKECELVQSLLEIKMKIAGTLTLLLLINSNSFGQDLSGKLQIDFLNRTFSDYFDSRSSTKNEFYILSDSIPSGIKTDFDNFKIHLIDYNQAYPLIEKDIISSLYWARIKQTSVDTVDIVIGGWSVDYGRVFRIRKIDGKRRLVTKNYNFKAWTGGTLGYIPQGRFVYSTELDEWSYIPEKLIVQSKLKKHRLE